MKMNKSNAIPLIILIIGIVIRLIYGFYFGLDYYGHDSPAHISYIKHIVENLELPKVDQGLEYPQQPLYYVTAGLMHRSLQKFDFSEEQLLKIIVWISVFSSIGTLICVYLLFKKFHFPFWLQSFGTGLFAFTPPFVYHAGMISNDPLLTFFSASSFLFLVYFLKEEKINYLLLAILSGFLASFSKISGGITLIIILTSLFLRSIQKRARKIILSFAVLTFATGAICIGFTMQRSYLPSLEKFHFVESYAWPGQKTNPQKISYFTSFNFIELLKEGQAYVFGNEAIARTFPTFLYGSFLFGEYHYGNITEKWPFIKFLAQGIIILALIFPVGLIINLFYLKKWCFWEWASFLGIFINLALIIGFLYKYPSVCNSDFRYFAPTFLPFVFLSAMGIYRLSRKTKALKFILPIICFSLISVEFLWISSRIAIKIILNV